jgi:hypothetical protein
LFHRIRSLSHAESRKAFRSGITTKPDFDFAQPKPDADVLAAVELRYAIIDELDELQSETCPFAYLAQAQHGLHGIGIAWAYPMRSCIEASFCVRSPRTGGARNCDKLIERGWSIQKTINGPVSSLLRAQCD